MSPFRKQASRIHRPDGHPQRRHPRHRLHNAENRRANPRHLQGVLRKKYEYRLVGISAVMADLSGKSRSKTFEKPTKDKETIHVAAQELFEKYLAETDLPIRRVGVKVGSFFKEERQQKQLTSFFQSGERTFFCCFLLKTSTKTTIATIGIMISIASNRRLVPTGAVSKGIVTVGNCEGVGVGGGKNGCN